MRPRGVMATAAAEASKTQSLCLPWLIPPAPDWPESAMAWGENGCKLEGFVSFDHVAPSNDAERSPPPVTGLHTAWSLPANAESAGPLLLAAPAICACFDHVAPSKAAYQRRWSSFWPFQAA